MEHISKAQIKFIRSLQQKKYRDESGLFVAEGEKCIEELRRGFTLHSLYREGENATHTEIEQMSSLRTPQGVIGVFEKAPQSHKGGETAPWADRQNLVLALDGVQNPGNLGTIIRTCDWFGVHDILCSPDTADCYNPKVVQATMGALARVHMHYVENLAEELERLKVKDEKLKIYGTLLDGRNMYEVLQSEGRSYSEAVLQRSGLTGEAGHAVIIMGNEGNGISQAVRRYITHPLYIPAYTDQGQIKETSDVVESLNVGVATAIVLAEFRRRLLF